MQASLTFPKLLGQCVSGGSRDGSDEQLIARIAAGDRRAMDTLYRRHHVRVYRFLLRLMKDAANAEDLTSDVFIDVWREARRFEGRSQVSTWMLAIARHKAFRALRRRVNDRLDDEMLANIPDDADRADVVIEKQRQSGVLQHGLMQLSPTHREVIDLVYYHGKSIAEVAEITDAPQATVKTRIHYARKRLAELVTAQRLDAAA
ncbi:MAG: sigma-70 family RNA polymerase sigma factor [Xanthobacteraceae bacterium]